MKPRRDIMERSRLESDLECLERSCDPIHIAECMDRIDAHIRRGEGLLTEHAGLRSGIEKIRGMLVSASPDLCNACRSLAESLRDHLRRESQFSA